MNTTTKLNSQELELMDKAKETVWKHLVDGALEVVVNVSSLGIKITAKYTEHVE